VTRVAHRRPAATGPIVVDEEEGTPSCVEPAGTPAFNRPVPVRHPMRWVGTAILAILGVVVVHSAATNPNFQWGVVSHYLFNHLVLRGVEWTLMLTVAAMALAIGLAIGLVFMRQSESPVQRSVSWLWIWFFRGTPVYTQLVFWGLVSVLYPHVALGVPFGPSLVTVTTSQVVTAAVAAIVGLGFNESAYLAEIFRAGFKSVDSGQLEAAEALGMRRARAMVRVVMPQAMRMIIPPTGNETIGMLKSTSLVLAVPFALDLTFTTNTIANRLYLPIPLLLVAGVWYLAITSVLMVGQHFLERRFGRGTDPRARVRQAEAGGAGS
jgi:polar amino acid transport system permease protein